MTLRQKVYNKFNGRCAYSGKELDEKWQIDHVVPRNSHHYVLIEMETRQPFDVEHIDNLIPCLRRLNHYKRNHDLEGWRRYLLTLHERLKRLPKNPKVSRSIKHKEYLLDVAAAFGITPETPFNGVFYFESVKASTQ